MADLLEDICRNLISKEGREKVFDDMLEAKNNLWFYLEKESFLLGYKSGFEAGIAARDKMMEDYEKRKQSSTLRKNPFDGKGQVIT